MAHLAHFVKAMLLTANARLQEREILIAHKTTHTVVYKNLWCTQIWHYESTLYNDCSLDLAVGHLASHVAMTSLGLMGQVLFIII